MNLNIETYKSSDAIHLVTFGIADKSYVEGLIARYKRYADDQDIHIGLAAGKYGLTPEMLSVYSTLKSFKQNIFECLLYNREEDQVPTKYWEELTTWIQNTPDLEEQTIADLKPNEELARAMKAKKGHRRSNRVSSDDGLERKRYTLWTNPPENWTQCFSGLLITPEIEAAVVAALKKVDCKKIDARTKAYRGNSYFAF